MKKFAKMSLVAAVAVAGFASTASAGSLEEAIKDTKISGYLRNRINTDHEATNDDSNNEIKIVVKTTTKVNDNVTASVKFVQDIWETGTAAGKLGESSAVAMSQMYFTYANAGLTVMAGRVPAVSPLTDNGNQGNGIVATYGMGPVTLAGAYYHELHGVDARLDDSNFDEISVYGVGVLGSVEMVNFAGWYLSTVDNINDSTAYTLGETVSAYALSADAKFGPVGMDVFYSDMDILDNGTENSFLKVGLNGSFGIVTANLDYIKLGEDSGNTTFDNDYDAAANFGLLVNDLMYFNDLDAWHIGLKAKVTDSITLGADHVTANQDSTSLDLRETELSAKYQMSKNFYVLGRYSFGKAEMAETDKKTALGDFKNSRIELQYTF